MAAYARDAHNLYLETLAELGPVGLALLLIALATPLAALRARPSSGHTAAGAAYAAFLVHAALDWDWEIPIVTLVALAAGASLLVLARASPRRAAWTRPLRAAAVGGASLLAVVALVAHVGNRAAAASEDAGARGRQDAVRSARRARSWQPWAAAPDRLLGEAQLARSHDAAAVRSLRDAIDRDRESWRAWYDLAVVTTDGTQRHALRRATALESALARAR